MQLTSKTGLVLAAMFLGVSTALAAATVSATAPATATAAAPAKAVAYDKYDGYFVNNTFEPNAPLSLVVVRDQAAFDKVFGAGFVMNDRSHRLPAGLFDKSLIVAAIRRGPYTGFTVESVTVKDGVLTVRYSAKQDAPGSATFNTPLILSVPKDGVKSVVFVENGKTVGEKAVN